MASQMRSYERLAELSSLQEILFLDSSSCTGQTSQDASFFCFTKQQTHRAASRAESALVMMTWQE